MGYHRADSPVYFACANQDGKLCSLVFQGQTKKNCSGWSSGQLYLAFETYYIQAKASIHFGLSEGLLFIKITLRRQKEK
jgi:hypothetical protein